MLHPSGLPAQSRQAGTVAKQAVSVGPAVASARERAAPAAVGGGKDRARLLRAERAAR